MQSTPTQNEDNKSMILMVSFDQSQRTKQIYVSRSMNKLNAFFQRCKYNKQVNSSVNLRVDETKNQYGNQRNDLSAEKIGPSTSQLKQNNVNDSTQTPIAGPSKNASNPSDKTEPTNKVNHVHNIL